MGKEWDAIGNGFRRRDNPADVEREDAFGRASRTSPEYRAGRAGQAWHEAWATEALRVLKPGGHLLAFGGTRTYHRLACAVEDAGFEIRDSLIWLYGSGFPKSLDVSKAIDKAAGAKREVVGYDESRFRDDSDHALTHYQPGVTGNNIDYEQKATITAPATPAARQWQGWGTALKPAHEPIVVARKPLPGTVAANVTEHGTGALNVDGCRVEGEVAEMRGRSGTAENPGGETSSYRVHNAEGGIWEPQSGGRWPANLLLSHSPECAELMPLTAHPKASRWNCAPGCPVAALDRQSGELHSQDPATRAHKRDDVSTHFDGAGSRPAGGTWYGDTGGASRFFYTAKASRGERSAGLSAHNGKTCVCPDRADQEPSPRRATSEPIEEVASDSSTIGNGSSTTGRSLTASRSTTETATKRTTGSRTSPSLAASTISDSTPRTIDEPPTEPGSDGARSAEDGSPPPPSTSTRTTEAGFSTADADPATSHGSSETSSSAGSGNSCPDCGGVIGGALRNAHPT